MRLVADGAAKLAAVNAERRAAVNAERERRLRERFQFQGKRYDFDAASQQRIATAAQWALAAEVGGAEPGDLFWHGGPIPFGFIAADNSVTTMDAPTVIAFGRAAGTHAAAHVFAAKALKEMAEIPADFAADSFWP